MGARPAPRGRALPAADPGAAAVAHRGADSGTHADADAGSDAGTRTGLRPGRLRVRESLQRVLSRRNRQERHRQRLEQRRIQHAGRDRGRISVQPVCAQGRLPSEPEKDTNAEAADTTNNAIGPSGGPGTTFSTIDGGSATVDQFRAKQSTLDGRLEYAIASPDIYIGVGYLQATNNYGYPTLHSFGVGLEKLPTFNTGLDWFASAYYYPNANGTWTNGDPTSSTFGQSFKLSYNIIKYDVGLNLNFGSSPFYIYGGFSGDRYTTKDNNEPIDQTHAGPYVGLGFHF